MKRYFTIDKMGEEVEVDSALASQLVKMGKKKPEDFEIEEFELPVISASEVAKSMQPDLQEQIAKERQQQFQEEPWYEKILAGIGKGMTDVGAGVKQIGMKGYESRAGQMGFPETPGAETAQQFGQRYKAAFEPYEQATKGSFAAGTGELIGEIAATSPVGGIFSPMGLLKAAVAEGAAIGALEVVDEPDESRLKNMAFGAAFALGTAAGARLAKKIGVKLYNSLMEKYSDKSVQELEGLVKKHGWTQLSLGDVTGKAGTRKSEVIAESKSLGLEKFRQKGHSEISSWLDDFVIRHKVKGGTPGELIQQSAQRRQKLVKEESSKLYKKVEKLSGGAKVEPANTIKEADKILKSFTSDVPTDEATASWFKAMRDNLATGKKNFASLRATRERLGQEARKYEMSDPPRRRLLLMLQSAVEKDMDNAIETQVESMTRRKYKQIQKLAGSPIMNPYAKREAGYVNKLEALRGRDLKKSYAEARQHYIENVLPYKTNPALKAALKTTEPTKIYNALVGDGMVDRARIFYKALDDKGKNAVKYGVLSEARKKAINEDIAGRPISPAKFLNYLNKADDLKNVFFDPKGQKEISGLKKLLNASIRFGQYAENPPTGNRLNITNLKREAWMTMGISPVKTLLDKFFWIGPGKKFLLAASELDPASTKMGELLFEIGKQVQKRTPAAAGTLGGQ